MLTREVRFTPVRGHRQAVSTCPKSAMNRLMHRRKQQLYSITWSARASSVGDKLRPSAFAVV